MRDTNRCPRCGGHVQLSHADTCCEDCTVVRGSTTGAGEERYCQRCDLHTGANAEGTGQVWVRTSPAR